MRICFIGPANSAHIVKWCNWFAMQGHEVHVISFTQGDITNAAVHLVDINVDVNGSDFGKIKYLLAGKRIRKIVEGIQPDVVNVHYATSYGASVALSGMKDYVLSVWGADVYDFPKKSLLHKSLLKYSLCNASMLFSTSEAMASEAAKYTDKSFAITPFGVDMNLFNPDKRTRSDEDRFVIGTIKGLSDKYGIRELITAAAIIVHEGDIPIELRIAGKGPQEHEYHILASELAIDDVTHWLGFISQEQAANEWANMDVAVVPSTLDSESFGVSAVEAQACGTPVIISDVPGLMEATSPGVTSLVVKRGNPGEIAQAITELYYNPKLLNNMKSAGRNYVYNHYEMNACFRSIEQLFLDFRIT